MLTFPADWLLVVVPFLAGSSDIFKFIVLTVFMFFVHLTSFGENSLFDYTQGYDKADPAKSGHPLEQGLVSVHTALNVIVWGKGILMAIGTIFTILWTPSNSMASVYAIFALFMWYAWGTAYNVGLSKESLFGFLPICICFTSMGAWAWLLSHNEFGTIGYLYLAFVFFTILFQISWSGHLKEMGQGERSNILIKMGASLTTTPAETKFEKGYNTTLSPYIKSCRVDGFQTFTPGKSKIYGIAVKVTNIIVAVALLLGIELGHILTIEMPLFWFTNIMTAILLVIAISLLSELIKTRVYLRAQELKNMGLEEIATIFLPIPILLGFWSIPLMLGAAAYYFVMNRLLWGTLYPKV